MWDVRCQEAPEVISGHVGVRTCYAMLSGPGQRLLVSPIIGVVHAYRMPYLRCAKLLQSVASAGWSRRQQKQERSLIASGQ